MDLDESRRRFWEEFIDFTNKKGKSPIFRELSKQQLNRTHAIEIYDHYGFRLVVGVNEQYARCSFHIKGRNHKDVRSRLEIIIEKLNKQFQMKREPEIFIKENPESVVLFLNDYSYQFPPRNSKEKEALMEWMYLNAIVMNEIPAYFEEKIHMKPKNPSVKNIGILRIERTESDVLPNKIDVKNIAELENNIYQCKSICKMPKERILLGRLMTGDPNNIELMLIGIGPNINYAEKRKQRAVFGEYGNTGGKVKKLTTMIERKNGSLSCWGTNAIKCDYEIKNEKATILACKKFLLREIEIIRPKVIVLFGSRLSDIFLVKPLIHGGVSTLFGKYKCIQSKHPAARESWEKNLKILAPKILEYL
jgi:uracil-DNA glycosylase family 4